MTGCSWVPSGGFPEQEEARTRIEKEIHKVRDMKNTRMMNTCKIYRYEIYHDSNTAVIKQFSSIATKNQFRKVSLGYWAHDLIPSTFEPLNNEVSVDYREVSWYSLIELTG